MWINECQQKKFWISEKRGQILLDSFVFMPFFFSFSRLFHPQFHVSSSKKWVSCLQRRKKKTAFQIFPIAISVSCVGRKMAANVWKRVILDEFIRNPTFPILFSRMSYCRFRIFRKLFDFLKYCFKTSDMVSRLVEFNEYCFSRNLPYVSS